MKLINQITTFLILTIGSVLQAQNNNLKPLVFIDPGHTIEFPGVLGTCGTNEVWVNDQISLMLAESLKKEGFRTDFTRTPNTDKSKIIAKDGREPADQLRARGAKANHQKADIFISIHHDSVPETALEIDKKACAGKNIIDPKVVSKAFLAQPDIQVGFNVFITRDVTNTTKNTQAIKLARAIGDEILKMGEKASTYHIPKYEPDCQSCKVEDKEHGVYSRTLGVLRNNQMPSVLIEITNLRIEKMEVNANDPIYQKAVVNAITQAVKNYFKN
jgi:N-acetylmuramoyl-L-alanine amidase